MGYEYWAFSITQNNYVHLALCLIQTGCEYWAHHTKTETTTDSHLIQSGSEYWALIIVTQVDHKDTPSIIISFLNINIKTMTQV